MKEKKYRATGRDRENGRQSAEKRKGYREADRRQRKSGRKDSRQKGKRKKNRGALRRGKILVGIALICVLLLAVKDCLSTDVFNIAPKFTEGKAGGYADIDLKELYSPYAVLIDCQMVKG